jgi:hypothetical protein
MLIGWFGNQWFMDFNSFYQIDLYLGRRVLDWRFYILIGEWGDEGESYRRGGGAVLAGSRGSNPCPVHAASRREAVKRSGTWVQAPPFQGA